MSIKLIYGKNGAGKSRLRASKSIDGQIVLNSNAYDWMNELLFEPLKKVKLSRFAKEITNIENELTGIKESFLRTGAPLEWSGISNLKPHISAVLEQEFNRVEFWTLQPIQVEDFEIDSIVKIREKYDLYKQFLSSLNEENYNSLVEVAKVTQNIKNLSQIGGATEIIRTHDTLIELIEEFIGTMNFQNIDRENFMSLLKEKPQVIELIKNNDSDKTTELIHTYIKNKLLSYSNKQNIVDLLNKLNGFKNSQSRFFANVVASTFGENIEINNGIVTISHGEGLSSGQLTVILSKLIVENSPQNADVWFDDVFETLDTNNQVELMEYLANCQRNVNVLTHMSNIFEVKDSLISQGLIDEDKVDTMSLQANGSMLSSSKSWAVILGKLRSVNPGDWGGKEDLKNIIRSIIKMLTRYHAKNSSIHAFKQKGVSVDIKQTDIYSHFGSWWFMHYKPVILEDEYLPFFEWITLRGDRNSTEILSEIINVLQALSVAETNRVKTETDIDVSKLIIYLSNLLNELNIEKGLYDSQIVQGQLVDLNDDQYITYRDLRVASRTIARNNNFIHGIDLSPDPITI